jgi:hypothetical protein
VKHKILNKNHRVGRWICLLGLIAMFAATTLLFASCACIAEPGARLTVENRFDFDVTIVQEATRSNGEHYAESVGIVPTGQTVETRVFMVSPGSLGETVIIKAEDSSENVVWEKSWPYDEFVKLKDVDWKIVVGPEKSS